MGTSKVKNKKKKKSTLDPDSPCLRKLDDRTEWIENFKMS